MSQVVFIIQHPGHDPREREDEDEKKKQEQEAKLKKLLKENEELQKDIAEVKMTIHTERFSICFLFCRKIARLIFWGNTSRPRGRRRQLRPGPRRRRRARGWRPPQGPQGPATGTSGLTTDESGCECYGRCDMWLSGRVRAGTCEGWGVTRDPGPGVIQSVTRQNSNDPLCLIMGVIKAWTAATEPSEMPDQPNIWKYRSSFHCCPITIWPSHNNLLVLLILTYLCWHLLMIRLRTSLDVKRTESLKGITVFRGQIPGSCSSKVITNDISTNFEFFVRKLWNPTYKLMDDG